MYSSAYIAFLAELLSPSYYSAPPSPSPVSLFLLCWVGRQGEVSGRNRP